MVQKRHAFIFMVMTLVGLLALVPARAQGDPRIEEFIGELANYDDIIYYDLYNLQAGETLYVYAEALQATLDPYIAVGDINFEEILAENDDIDFPDNLNSALEYTIPEDGDYSVAITAATEDQPAGKYRIVFGIDAPEVLDGDAEPTGDRIAVLYVGDSGGVGPGGNAPAEDASVRIQELSGSVDDSQEEVTFIVSDLQADDVLYVYVEAPDDQLDTILFVTDLTFEDILAENDDIDYPDNTNSAVEFRVPEDGDYAITVSRYDDSSSGDFLLLVGVNAPEVLDGEGEPTGEAFVFAGEAPDETGLPDNTVTNDNARIEEFTGTLDGSGDPVFYDLMGVQAGETIYVYAEAISGDLDTVLALGDITFEDILVENDDISSDNRNSALQYTVTETGDFSVGLSPYEGTAGEYRLQIGINAPEVLNGTAIPTGDRVAVLYGDRDSIPAADCSELAERPDMSGPEKTLETRYFIIHYTLSGSDGAEESFVEQIAEIVDSIWRFQVIEQGWPAPPPDCGEGGDRRYDIYMLDILGDGILGYAQPEGLVVDNPASPAVEQYAAYSHLVIDNDYESYDDPTEVVLATLAHEFHHAIQFGYDINDAAGWYYEATATWMETQNYPDVEEATPYVESLFETADLCVGATPEDAAFDTRIYAEWLLIDSIARDFGVESILGMWDIIAVEENMNGLYALAESLGTTPQEMVLRMAVRNVLLDYGLAERFGVTVRIEAEIDGEGSVTPFQSGVQELGVDYVQIEAQGVYEIAVDGEGLTLYVVGIDGDDAVVFDLGAGATVDTRDFDDAFVIIFNTTQHEDSAACEFVDWELSVSEGDAADAVAAMPADFSAENFDQ